MEKRNLEGKAREKTMGKMLYDEKIIKVRRLAVSWI